jgi:protein O-mannosyl-transferase
VRPARIAIAVAVLTAALWSTGIRGDYHFDDAITPLADPASQSLTAFAHHLPDTLRPLTKLTYAAEASAELGPQARRGVTIAIHAAAAALLVLLLLALAPRLTPIGAGMLALVWAAHPIHAEAVLAITGRTTALSTALVIAALLAHARDRTRTGAVLLALAGLARETAIVAVLALAVLELATTRSWRRLIPAVLASVVVAVWLIATPRVRELADFSFTNRDIGTSLAHQHAAIPVGLSLYVRTWALSIDHGSVLTTPLAIAGLALYAVALASIVVLRRRAPLVAIGAAIWVAAIAPTQSFVPKLDPLTERPLSSALVGVVVALGAVTSRHLAKILAALALALAVATISRGQLYRSDLSLWADAAAKSETNARPHVNYAYHLHQAGRDTEALGELDRAHDIDPTDLEVGHLRAALRARP